MKKTRKLFGFAAIIMAITLNVMLMTGCSLLPEADLDVDRIEITKQPAKKTYTVGETLSTAGMEVTAYYVDGTSKVVDDYSTSNDSLAAVGQVTVTVTYKGKTATFTVTVNPAAPVRTLSKIEVTTPPAKTKYNINEQLDTAGMVVTATYSDNTTEAVNGYTTGTLDSATAGEKTVTVTYQGKDATFKVTVQAAIPSFPSGVYGITGTGTAFTAYRNNAVIGTADQPIQTVINGIKADVISTSNPATIQFGDGTTTLSIGSESINFENTSTSGVWGAVTLSGRITSGAYSNKGTIIIDDNISITSTANIASTGGATGRAVINNSTGTVKITGGTVSVTTAYAVYNSAGGTIEITGGTVSAGSSYAVYNSSTGAVNISGGTVSATTGCAVYSASSGKITISGTAKVTSANTGSSSGTIQIAGSGTANDRLLITNGTVENTAAGTNARTIYNSGNGTVTISGGAVTGTEGRTVDNNSTGAINISGGTVSATTGRAVNNGSANGAINVSGGTVSATSGIAVYNFAGKVTVSGTTTKVTSRNQASSEGTITIVDDSAVNTSPLRLEVTGGTVENTLSIPGSSGGYAIYNAHSKGSQVVSITAPPAVITGKKFGTP